ncbi:MAG: carboxylating nicotinate-nucleotide diphosphorylase, partial [Lacipirellulaceae bacterium]
MSKSETPKVGFTDFEQFSWDDRLEADCQAIVELARQEDLGEAGDWTTNGLVSEESRGSATVVTREEGVLAGVAAIETCLGTLDADLKWQPLLKDGDPCKAGQSLGELSGKVRDLLSYERILLNLVGLLSGIATLASEYVARVEGTQARIYDTRKTTPGWRRLEKFATRCGGACNHRTGLFDAVMIKDNHLAHFRASTGSGNGGPRTAEAVTVIRKYLENEALGASIPIEIEVDTITQLEAVLPVQPDIVLLDNMSLENLRSAVALRDEKSPSVQLEASGG